ncbi:MAG: Asp-tRNA(Asn)/Glu-tRNA(Gln) amidotransferase subunit GatC [Candidatus Hydrogenedentes bacterium]|nr:Asp-tRNA(Asn)/Glu-tRNA(Gln) amidotransferase subunit GatC [Candidatus Hydrogenedentota bacterium]
MSKITEKDVSYVAALAQLQLDDAARTRLVKEMGDILSYMDTLNALDTEGVEPMMHALEMTNVFREDEVGTPLSHEEALKNAPLDDGAYFLVPKILDGGGKS